MIPLAFVDDKAVNRNSFIQKIQSFTDLEISFVAVDGNDCLEQLKGLPLHKQPKVVFVDLEMPGLDGIQTIQIAKPLYPQTIFIVLTVFDDEEKIFEAIKAGADGYLLKDENAIGLHNAITSAIEHNGAPMSPAIARKALEMLSTAQLSTHASNSSGDALSLLTEREKEILQHTIKGHDAKNIAELLTISVLTVRKHISNIYDKLHVRSKAQIMNLAHQRKWFE